MKLVGKLIVTGLVVSLSACGKGGGLDKMKQALGVGDADNEEEKEAGEGEGSSWGKQESPLNLVAGLRTFESCSEAETYIEDQLVIEMRRNIEQQIYWMKKYKDRGVPGEAATSSPSADGGDMAESADEDSSNDSPTDYTTTNNQVEGVEEADILKNTGTHIYHLAAGKLQIIQSWPAESMKSLGTLKVEGRMFEMLLEEGDRLVLIGNPLMTELDPEYAPEKQFSESKDGMADVAYPYPGGENEVAWNFVKVVVIDVANKSQPKIKDSYLMKGSFAGARRVESSVRVILRDYRPYPDGLVWWLPWETAESMSENEQIAYLNEQMVKNEVLIREKDLEFWVDAKAFVKVTGDVRTPALDLESCQNIHAPKTSAQMGMTRVATLNLDAATINQTLLFAYAGEIYSSKTGLYLATPYWWWNDESRDTDFTFFHRFDVSTPDHAVYLGSGGVEGTLLNQFSMDEHNDNLRVATTISRHIKDDTEWGTWETTNRVSVLGLKDNALVVLGQTPDLAKGERVFSARFVGDRGFVVTFRQVDPLFTIDLSDPAAPTVKGELKIPGFSNYMQPIDENHILAIGQDATLEGQVQQGLKLSLFDVSDMANPKEAHTLVLDGNIWSEAQWNHKAFTYFPARKLLAIPASGYSDVAEGDGWWGRYRSMLLVFDIDASTGISKRGELDVSDIYIDKERPYQWWRTAATVSRSIFADDYVYAITNLGIRATKTDALDTEVSTVRYGCDDGCFDHWYWYY